MAVVRFTVPGVPHGKARPRATARLIYRDGRPEAIVTVHSDRAMRALEAEVLRLFRQRHPGHMPWTGPVMLRFTAVFPIPTSWPKALQQAAAEGKVYHCGTPDKDNIEKLIVDALTPPQAKRGKAGGPKPGAQGFAWVGDGQVQGGGVKRYGLVPRIDVELESLFDAAIPATPAMKRAEQALQPQLALPPARPIVSNSTKVEKEPPQLAGYSDRQRDLIERALARDAVAQVKRQKAKQP
jgi:Holliday junction resolvase RusA-like endonuclease